MIKYLKPMPLFGFGIWAPLLVIPAAWSANQDIRTLGWCLLIIQFGCLVEEIRRMWAGKLGG